MEDSYKEHLEGLLQARSQDIRHGLRPRRRRLGTAAVLNPPAGIDDAAALLIASARLCEACRGQIDTRRLRALPNATLCLDCRRAAERAGTAT